MDRFAFEHIQGLKASATPAPKTSLKLSGPFWCVKFTCNTEDDIRQIHFITGGHNTFLYGSVNGPIKPGKRKQKLYISKVSNKILQGLHELIFFFDWVVDKSYAVISQFNMFGSFGAH